MTGTGIESVGNVGIGGVIEPIGYMPCRIVVKPNDGEPALGEIRGGVGESPMFARAGAPLDAVDNEHVETELTCAACGGQTGDSPADNEEVAV